jgi:hypothetical protein
MVVMILTLVLTIFDGCNDLNMMLTVMFLVL